MVSAARMCLICKGSRALCGHARCPLLARMSVEPKVKELAEKEFFGPSTSVFVGRFGYPNVGIGPLAAMELKDNIDNPATWLSLDYSDIIELRSLMLRSRMSQNVHARNRYVYENQELALATKPTDVEMSFSSKPLYRVSFSDIHQPMGPSASLEKLTIAENPHIPRKIDYIVSDDVKAFDAGVMLYRDGQDVYRISTILSSGVLGMKDSRKLVPTRWSITATDSLLFDYMVSEVKEFPSVNEFQVFSHQALNNRFEILLMPGNWEYENFEAWAPGGLWTASLKRTEILEEYEPFEGRTKYADKEGGGYYASRLGVIEGLRRMGRQARVIVFREVYEGYTVPLGVWQVRENVREAMGGESEKFNTLQEALLAIGTRLRLKIKDYTKQSRIIRQSRIMDF
jgi:hypothetical protein